MISIKMDPYTFTSSHDFQENLFFQNFDGNFKAIFELPVINDYGAQDCDKIGVATDVETTGTDVNVDKITEFTFLPFRFNAQGEIGEVLSPVTWMNDPGVPIPEYITQLTGITNEMVAGKSAPADEIAKIYRNASLMIAHNAKFDRSFEEAYLAEHGLEVNKPWICTVEDIDWNKYQIHSAKLDYLAYRFGFYFNHHRSENDCRALVHLLAARLPSGNTALGEAFQRGLAPRSKVLARGSAFETKDILRQRGYRWSPDDRVWWIEVSNGDLNSEQEWLQHHVYNQNGAPEIQPISVLHRFKR